MAALCVATLVAVGAPAGAKTASKSSEKALATLKITADGVSVKKKGASDYTEAKDGQTLSQGDSIKTDASGTAEIDYTDGSLTRLSPATIFTLTKLSNERGGRQTQGTLSVGETWNRAAKVSETGEFSVKAGGTTAAVEGTAFIVKCVPNSDPSAKTASCTVQAVVDNIDVTSDAWDLANSTDAN
ncbi:MAG: FecR domain-containing protein [Acidimicrobiia bacterium]